MAPRILSLALLQLRNFKGTREFAIEPRGKNIAIYGANASGKTTLADAFFWLLFDKDSKNKKDFEIKTLGADGKPVHNLEHEVWAELELDRKPVALQKVYKETWTKKRGSLAAEFTGHTTDYKVNSVPVQKGEYDRQIAEICDEKKFRLLTDPTCFNTVLSWQDRRKILLDVCGDVTDADVIAANPELSALPGILGDHSAENYRKIVTANRKKANEEIESIPVRIDEIQRGLGEDVDPAEIELKLAELRTQQAELREKELRINSGGEVTEKTVRIREIEAEVQRLRNEANGETARKVDESRQALAGAEAEVSKCKSAIEGVRYEIDGFARLRETLEGTLAQLREDYEKIKAKTPALGGIETECPACGQALPADKVEAARAKAEEEFNAKKARELEANIAEGKSTKSRLTELLARADAATKKIEDLGASLAVIEANRDELKGHHDELRTAAASIADSNSVRALLAQIESIKLEIEQLRAGSNDELQGIHSKLAELSAGVTQCERSLASINARKSSLARIDELGAQQKTLAAQIEKIDSEIHLIEEFIRAKVAMLTERINGRFGLAKFRLFEEQINGGIAEVCETTVDGVPYSDLNTGSKLNVGLDIIDTLAQHYGFAPPIFIDNAESVTNIRSTIGQQVWLVVSAADSKLRVEALPVATTEPTKAQGELLTA